MKRNAKKIQSAVKSHPNICGFYFATISTWLKFSLTRVDVLFLLKNWGFIQSKRWNEPQKSPLYNHSFRYKQTECSVKWHMKLVKNYCLQTIVGQINCYSKQMILKKLTFEALENL